MNKNTNAKSGNITPRAGSGASGTNDAANQTFLMDIGESVRQDEMKKAWKEYGPYLIAGIALAVILTGVLSAYRSWDKTARVDQTTALIQAMEAPDTPQALEGLAATLRPGHRAIARLTQAAALVEGGRKAEAVVVFEALAADKAAPELYRDLALLESVRLRAAEDGADLLALRAQLQPLTRSQKSPWYAQAALQAAVLTAHGAQDYKAAREYLDAAMNAPGVPATLVQKARALDHVYAIRAAAGGAVDGGQAAGAGAVAGKAAGKKADRKAGDKGGDEAGVAAGAAEAGE